MTISVLKSRAALEAVPVQIEPPVWDEVARELKSLVGMEGVREELLTIARTLQNIKAHRERHHLRHLPQLHCVIEGPPGGGSASPSSWPNCSMAVGWRLDPCTRSPWRLWKGWPRPLPDLRSIFPWGQGLSPVAATAPIHCWRFSGCS